MKMMRWSAIMALATFLVVANAQPSPLPDYNCSANIKKAPPLAKDPCANTTAYSQLGSCGAFLDGNVTTPSAECCASAQSVWSKLPACFCKVTFFSIFSDPGPARALERPRLCNITDDLCTICPSAIQAFIFSNPSDNPPDYECAADIRAKFKVPANDPCSGATVYSELGACANYLTGNVTTPSAECCQIAQDVSNRNPACFCKLTFFSKIPGSDSVFGRARNLCGINASDLCNICPAYLESGGGHSRKLNTASVVTISVIVTLAVVGCVLLVYCCRKRALAKKNQSTQSKSYVPQFNNM